MISDLYTTLMASATRPVESMRMCNCIGPQDGKPVCPCAMQGVEVKDGRYVRVLDLGEVKQ